MYSNVLSASNDHPSAPSHPSRVGRTSLPAITEHDPVSPPDSMYMEFHPSGSDGGQLAAAVVPPVPLGASVSTTTASAVRAPGHRFGSSSGVPPMLRSVSAVVAPQHSLYHQFADEGAARVSASTAACSAAHAHVPLPVPVAAAAATPAVAIATAGTVCSLLSLPSASMDDIIAVPVDVIHDVPIGSSSCTGGDPGNHGVGQVMLPSPAAVTPSARLLEFLGGEAGGVSDTKDDAEVDPSAHKDDVEGRRRLRKNVPSVALLHRVKQLCGIQLSNACMEAVHAAGPDYFTRREFPFSDADVKDPKPKVKQTPIMRYAQGTAYFIQARNAGKQEGTLYTVAFSCLTALYAQMLALAIHFYDSAFDFVAFTPSAERLGELAVSRFSKSLSMNQNDAATLANYGFCLDSIFKDAYVWLLRRRCLWMPRVAIPQL
jgi:hypothetical protein